MYSWHLSTDTFLISQLFEYVKILFTNNGSSTAFLQGVPEGVILRGKTAFPWCKVCGNWVSEEVLALWHRLSEGTEDIGSESRDLVQCEDRNAGRGKEIFHIWWSPPIASPSQTYTPFLLKISDQLLYKWAFVGGVTHEMRWHIWAWGCCSSWHQPCLYSFLVSFPLIGEK